MIKCIIFDFDGTLADTYEEIKKIVNDLQYPKIKNINFEEVRDKGIRKMVKEAEIPLWKLPRFSYDVLKKLKEKKSTKIFPGTKIILNELVQDYKIGIVSSSSKENIEQTLKKKKIFGLFEFIYSDSSLFGKDKVLKRMLKNNNLNPNEILYVGDEDRDILAAKKVGIKIIAVTWGFNSKERLLFNNPDYIVDSPREITRILNKK